MPQMVFTATEAIGFSYGVTWNTVRRNIFNWKHERDGQPGSEGQELLRRPARAALPEGLHPLRGEGRGAAEVHPAPAPDDGGGEGGGRGALDPKRIARGLVWHTQGSGKTYTMIKAAELLFKAAEADKPTVLLMIDRNELEDQMLKNLAALGLDNVAARRQHRRAEQAAEGRLPRHHRHDDPQVPRHAGEPQHAAEHLRADRRGPPHDRRRPGQLPDGRASRTPSSSASPARRWTRPRTARERSRPSAARTTRATCTSTRSRESIEDGTTLPLYYNLAPNEMLVPHELMEKEFLVARRDRGHRRHRGAEQDPRPRGEPEELPQGQGARRQGRAVRGRALPRRTSSRSATRRFSSAWTAKRAPITRRRSTSILPPEYSEVVYTGNNNDPAAPQEVAPRREEGEADPQELRQGRRAARRF